MIRIFDTKNDTWVKDIYLSPYPHNNLYMLKKNIFGKDKVKLVSSENYVVHKDIEVYDKNQELIFEGDYCKLYVEGDREVIGLIAYVHEWASYVAVCLETNEFFDLSSELSEYIEVIGNVFDGYENNKE